MLYIRGVDLCVLVLICQVFLICFYGVFIPAPKYIENEKKNTIIYVLIWNII